MRRGISAIVAIILALIILFFLAAFITGTVIPFFKTVPETTSKTYYSLQGINPENYYEVNIQSNPYSHRGHLELTVTDPETGDYVTDFPFPSAFQGYSISEDTVPTTVQSIMAYKQLYIANVFESGVADCSSHLAAIESMKFNSTYVGFFPSTGTSNFVSKNVASCAYTGKDYLTAIKNATFALPSGQNYNALVIVSDGDCTNCPSSGTEAYNDLIKNVGLGLHRSDIQTAVILTSNVANCESNPLLNFTRVALGIEKVTDENTGAVLYYKSPDGRRRCEQIGADVFGSLAFNTVADASTIGLNYKAIAPEDGLKHKIAVRATKKPYTGRGEQNITYG